MFTNHYIPLNYRCQIFAPENFNFNQPEEWPQWFRKFEHFRQALGMYSKDKMKQVNAFIYSMNDAADDILSSMYLSEDNKKRYRPVKTKFDERALCLREECDIQACQI